MVKANVAFALAILVGGIGVFGVGHFYSRRWGRGFVWLATGALGYGGFWAFFSQPTSPIPPALLALWSLGALGLWLGHAYDAYRLAGGEPLSLLIRKVCPGDVRPLKALPVWGLGLLVLPIAQTWLICQTGVCSSEAAALGIYSLAAGVSLGLLIALLKVHQVALTAIGWRRPTSRDLVPAVVTTFIGLFGVYPVATSVSALWGMSLQGMTFSASGKEILILLLGPVAIAPLAEELLFRGFGLGFLLSRGLSPWIASGLIIIGFAAIHTLYFGLSGVFLILLWGILPTVLRLWQGTVVAAWLMHTLNNAVAYLVFPILL